MNECWDGYLFWGRRGRVFANFQIQDGNGANCRGLTIDERVLSIARAITDCGDMAMS